MCYINFYFLFGVLFYFIWSVFFFVIVVIIVVADFFSLSSFSCFWVPFSVLLSLTFFSCFDFVFDAKYSTRVKCYCDATLCEVECKLCPNNASVNSIHENSLVFCHTVHVCAMPLILRINAIWALSWVSMCVAFRQLKLAAANSIHCHQRTIVSLTTDRPKKNGIYIR